jgi:hypothetical protein
MMICKQYSMNDGLQSQVTEAVDLLTLQYKPQTFSQLTRVFKVTERHKSPRPSHDHMKCVLFTELVEILPAIARNNTRVRSSFSMS